MTNDTSARLQAIGTEATQEKPVRAWYVVVLLCAIYVLSSTDRSILPVLATDVASVLKLSNAQLGLLMGAAFSVVYAFAGPLFAHWIDNRERTWCLVFGVVFWSSATIASAFAPNYATLLLCRSGVALGEAVLIPAAVSLIGDLFPSERRTWPMAAFGTVGGVMAIGSFPLGAAALQTAGTFAHHLSLQPWQLTFILVGTPGVLLALLFRATIREPGRIISAGPQEATDVRGFVSFIGRRVAFYGPFLLATGVATTFAMSLMAWSPTILVREHGFSPAAASYNVGMYGLPGVVCGAVLWPLLASVLDRRYPRRGALVALLVATLAGAPAVLAVALGSSQAFMLGVTAALATFAAWGSLPSLIIQRFAPNGMRARLSAFNLLSAGMIGYGLGPLLAVYLAQLSSKEAGQISQGIALLGLICLPVSTLCYALCLRMERLVACDAS